MKYTPKNASGSKVYDNQAGAEIHYVAWVDTDTGEVCVVDQPVRKISDEEVATHIIKFDRIKATDVQGMVFRLDCYGRQHEHA